MEQDLNGKPYEAGRNLDGIVGHFYHIYSAVDAAPVVKHISPSLEMVLVFNFGLPVEISFGKHPFAGLQVDNVAVIGPLRKMLNYKLPAGSNAIVLNFVLNGFYRLFKVPLSEVAAKEFYTAHELPHTNYLLELWQEMAAMENIQDRLQMLREFISSVAAMNEDAVQPLLDGEAYFFDRLTQPVKAMAADSGLTERSIQLRFRKYTGYSPKELLRFLRFKSVINYLLHLNSAEVDIFQLIDNFNYHDQSHLIKDFNYFLDTTPLKFINELKGREFCVTGQHKADD
jgi:AraC-like DNA-binding protein